MKVVKKTFLDKWFETEIHESVIEPNMPIIDSHHHLWDISLSKTHSKFKQKVYLYDDFLRDINKSGHNIIDTVYVQCRYHYKNNVSEEYKCIGLELGFLVVESGALVRSSYHADEQARLVKAAV